MLGATLQKMAVDPGVGGACVDFVECDNGEKVKF